MTLAHAAIQPGQAWGSWTFDPVALASIALAAWLYARGHSRLVAKGRHPIGTGQVAAFYGGLLLVLAALASPLDALAGTLVSAHMVQHLILLVLAPPLLVYARPGLVLGMGLPPRWRRALNRATHGTVATRTKAVAGAGLSIVALHAAAMWAWHLPGPYQAAVGNNVLHALEHATFLGSALAFWATVIQPRRRQVSYGAGILYCFAVWMISGGLGAILSFATHPLYPVLARNAPSWGLSPLTDQQLAGVIMWVPAGIVYLVAMAALFLRWMSSMERRMENADARLAEARR